MSKRWVLLVIVCLLPSVVAGQTTRRMFVDATTNVGAAAVLDLKDDEFSVTEGGERREISKVTRTRRPMRLILIVDSGEGIRQPIGQVRKALAGFVETVDAQHEAMLVTVAGTLQVRVQPTLERQQLLARVNDLFGTSGANTMHRAIEETVRRFGQTTQRPVLVVVTTEGLGSLQEINPKQITKISEDVRKRGGVLHAVRLLVPIQRSLPAGDTLTEMPISMMISRGTGGIYRDASPASLADVLQQLATEINREHERAPLGYEVEYASGPTKGRTPAVPEVRVTREGVRLSVITSADK